MSLMRVQELRSKAISASSVRLDGSYTLPRTWGVYEIDPPLVVATSRFRMGNYPVRQRELEREFERATLCALFPARSLAAELAALLNQKREKT